MIGKVPKPGKGFKGLVSYLLRGDRKKPLDKDRVAWCETRNLILDDPEKAPALMRATAARSKRVQAPVYHYVISWHRDEAPSDAIMRQVADVTCADLGLSEHQALYIAHKDTEHRHVHIVVNRVHPETHIAWKTSHDYRRIEQSLRRQSEAMGLDYVPGRFNDPERFRAERIARRPKNPRFQKARRLGKPLPAPDTLSAGRRAAFLAVYNSATSWDQLHSALGALGFRLEGKGQGAVVVDGDREHKLSAFSKETRLRDLQRRFGKTLADSLTDLHHDSPRDDHHRRAKDRKELTEILSDANLVDTTVHATQLRALRHVAQQAEPSRTQTSALRQSPVTPPEKPKTEDLASRKAFAAYDDAAATLDLAYALHNLGLVDDRQLDAAVREHDAAQAEVNKHQSTIDQLTADAAKYAFRSDDTPTSRDEQAEMPEQPEPEDDDQPTKKRRRGRRR